MSWYVSGVSPYTRRADFRQYFVPNLFWHARHLYWRPSFEEWWLFLLKHDTALLRLHLLHVFMSQPNKLQEGPTRHPVGRVALDESKAHPPEPPDVNGVAFVYAVMEQWAVGMEPFKPRAPFHKKLSAKWGLNEGIRSKEPDRSRQRICRSDPEQSGWMPGVSHDSTDDG